jgi:hypothetical protein
MAGLEMIDATNPIPFIMGDLPYEPKAEALILLHKTVSD